MSENTDITNEQLFEFMTKMYSEMQEMEQNMATKDDMALLEQKMATKDDVALLEQKMATKHDIVRLENKMDANHKALYDGYQLNYEKLNALEDKVNEINGKIEKQDVEIRVIKGAK